MIDTLEQRLKQRKVRIFGQADAVEFAVLVPLIEHQNELSVLFEVRSRQLKRQPGEICFPGGKIDPGDSSPSAAALRETCEELGIEEKDVSILGPLDFLVFPSFVHPFVGHIKSAIHLPNPDEVEEIFYVPLSFLQETTPQTHSVRFRVQPSEGFPYHMIPGGEKYGWRERTYVEYFYTYKDYVIWGMTARILRQFLQTLEEEGLAL